MSSGWLAPGRELTPTQTHIMEPIAVPIPKASEISGMSRSAIYRELGAGNLRAVKQGARTLVLVDSIRGYPTRLPEARFRKGLA